MGWLTNVEFYGYLYAKAGFGLRGYPGLKVKVVSHRQGSRKAMVITTMTCHGRGVLGISGFPVTGKPGGIAETRQRG